ncbi:hypothetical protein [Bacillus sp. FJAT-45350]|nr:hypothetical protein [Bacillus sp. FJAT-45350]
MKRNIQQLKDYSYSLLEAIWEVEYGELLSPMESKKGTKDNDEMPSLS